MVDGTITLRDKTTGRLFRGHVLEDAGDAGDAYDYSPLDEPPILSTGLPGKVKMIHPGPLVGTVRVTLPLRLPARLGANRRHRTPGRVACPITLDVTVTAGSPIVEFTTTVENRAEDHRLRVLFSTGIHSDRWAADTAFGVVERSTTRPAGEGWTQRPQPTAPHQSWVDATDGGAGLAVLSTGLPEHEVIDSGEGLNVALTLLRCVGSLSRDDLRTRAGHAGPGYPTPEAQCLGAHRFRYALFAHAGGWEEAGVPARALDWRVPMRAEPTSRHPGSLPGAHTFVTCEGAMLSAIKPPERGEGFIIRVYNSGATEGRAVIRANLPLREVREVSLGEEDIGDVGSQDGVIELVMRPFQIRTIRLVLRE
jgi:alpha-mannosidase